MKPEMAKIKTNQALMQVQSGICDAELIPELIGLKGSQKRNWIRCHYSEFKKFYDTYGPSRTMQRYGISRRSTLDAMLSSSELPKLDRSERALLKAEHALETSKEALRLVRENDIRLEDILPMANLGFSMIQAMCKAVPGLEYHPKEMPDRLRIGTDCYVKSDYVQKGLT